MKNSFLPIEEAPFLRILLPFVTGVLLQYFLPYLYFIYLFPFLGTIFLIKYYTSRLPQKRFINRYYFGLATFLFYVAIGIATLLIKQKGEQGNCSKEHKYAIASIIKCKETQRAICCEAEIKEWIQYNGKTIHDDQKVILYFKPDDYSRSLIKNNIIVFRPKLTPIANSKNPESFDYASYMRYRGFLYTQYLDTKDWKRVGYNKDKSIRGIAHEIQESASKELQKNNFSKSSYAILNALLLGNTECITTEIRNGFSTSGLSHILAVSGLHTGIIWTLLYVLFIPLVWIKMSRLRPIFTLLFLWAYAFLTGLSPSAVRATIMISFILFGQILNRKGTTFNSLFAAAFFMLLYNPYYLFNASFQLSFIAVFSILYIYPVFYNLIKPLSKWGSYIVSVLCVSTAAQIGTLPLTIYYFHELPLLSLPANLIIMPFLPLILGGGICILMLDYMQIPADLLVNGLDKLLTYIEQFTQIISALSFSSIQNIWMDPHFIIFWFVLIFTLFWSFRTRRSDILIFTLSFAVLFIATDFLYKRPPIRNAWIVYHDNHNTTINFIDNGINYIFNMDSEKADSTIEKKARKFWMKNDVGNIINVKDSTKQKNLMILYPFIHFKGNNILLLNSKYWMNKISKDLFPIDYAIISHGFSGKLSDISKIFDIKTVILCADLNYFKHQALQKESYQLGIYCYSIKNSGAWIFNTETQLRIPSTTSD
ncbi:ComEC/Rec2 family competence protein [Coprobacter sp.]